MRWIWVLPLFFLAGCKPGERRLVVAPPTELNKRVSANDLSYVLNMKPDHPELEMEEWPNPRPLVAAIRMRQKDLAIALIEKGASLNLASDRSQSPLKEAIQTGDVEMVEMLLDRGASVGHKGFGYFPIHVAARQKNSDLVRLLIKRGANPNEISPANGETPLELALANNNWETAKVLISAGAKREISDSLYLTEKVSEQRLAELGIVRITRQFDQQKFLREHPDLRPSR